MNRSPLAEANARPLAEGTPGPLPRANPSAFVERAPRCARRCWSSALTEANSWAFVEHNSTAPTTSPPGAALAEASVGHYRALAEGDADASLHGLARSLNMLLTPWPSWGGTRGGRNHGGGVLARVLYAPTPHPSWPSLFSLPDASASSPAAWAGGPTTTTTSSRPRIQLLMLARAPERSMGADPWDAGLAETKSRRDGTRCRLFAIEDASERVRGTGCAMVVRTSCPWPPAPVPAGPLLAHL